MSRLELKERYGLIQYEPGDKTKRAVHLIRLNGYSIIKGRARTHPGWAIAAPQGYDIISKS
jgi:urease beta subunit